MDTAELLTVVAMGAAAVAGYGLIQEWLRIRAAARHRASLRNEDLFVHGRHAASSSRDGTREGLGASLTEGVTVSGGFERALIEYMAVRTLQARMGPASSRSLKASTTRAADEQLAKAGLGGVVSAQGFFNARVRLALVFAAAGLLIGCVLSAPLAMVLGCIGAAAGWIAPRSVVKSRARRRADELEHHLPETLDVIALGLRGGLSFDRSLDLYTAHFKSELAKGLALAENQWSYGLLSRSEALRDLSATYDSPLFARVVENIIRSLRFGSSLAESLESTAVEARQTYQAKKQEQVAKAPIKIMIPTGALILPAMLMLVLGPVLLELIGSF